VVPKTILFDFDGTIANTIPAGVLAFNELARKYGFTELTTENGEMLRGKGARAAMKALSVPIYRVPTVLRGLRNGIHLALPGVRTIDGMHAVLMALKEKGYQLGIVTSNSAENVRQFLKDNQLEYFDYLRAGAGLFGKARAIKRLVTREKLKKHELVFIGDEIRDIEAAKKNEMVAIGVTWGINSRAGLESANADFVVDTAAELAKLL
jgi:phosphoglycolate phosphatase